MGNEYSSLPENELLALARGGNEEAFTTLVRQNSPMIYKISRRVLKKSRGRGRHFAKRTHKGVPATGPLTVIRVFQPGCFAWHLMRR